MLSSRSALVKAAQRVANRYLPFTSQIFRRSCQKYSVDGISSDIPSMDDRWNVSDAILRVSTHIRSTKRKMDRWNMTIFRVSTPHREWPYVLDVRKYVRASMV